jgi:hypothetical protein
MKEMHAHKKYVGEQLLKIEARQKEIMAVGGNLQPGGGMHPHNPSLGRVWGRPRSA